MADPKTYDVVIVGAGIAGGIIALELGRLGKHVLILEAGAPIPASREQYMENFFLSAAKTPESPYPPKTLAPAEEATPRPTILGLNNWKNAQKSYLVQPTPDPTFQPKQLPFASTYERIGGGTTWHWLGTSLRLVPDDLVMHSYYKAPGFGPGTDWPIEYSELETLYGKAEDEIGVSASVAEQAPLQQAIGLTYPAGYQYPMQAIPESLVDEAISQGVSGMSLFGQPVFVTPTPAGRNSQPRANRPVCAGNTNCIPICPIQAKYDATVTLNAALNTGNVDVQYRSVVTRLLADTQGRISSVEYITYNRELKPGPVTTSQVSATTYVLAAHAIENPKILLNSKSSAFPNGLANSSDQLGRNLMDHVLYLSWALMPEGKPVFPYRGPLSTSGIESLRNGPFRSQRAAFRMEIGNEGWNFPIGDPYATVNDFINGTNVSALNPVTPPGTPQPSPSLKLGGRDLVMALNDRLTRQFRMACLIEQSPQAENRVTLDPTLKDGLGLPRPKISYGFDKYTLDGFMAAKQASSAIYQAMGATEFTDYSKSQSQPGYFEYEGQSFVFFGAGHVMGTHRMGSDPKLSVVDANQRSHDHENLWIVGSGSFPTVATPNPTLTLAALAFKTAASLGKALTL
ncbi:GMC family oxidoreductase [Corallococcus praedator]|uniref:GMC family oxidoreductase n=1 Tax=Corallococcus praedator TaxID=2316724 RepID=A0ABX9QDJ0_9BACT|nr:MULTISPECIES: GMC family oxidoreductase [Corallococcus]RKH10365.1 GMC family oxidoreductase [Corallococcus sp. CA047B]RKH25688.1 GMC family oxidoreductase [Corallococcus sp. CA031C]RKI02931.1 GMC family oxidoreductase [Corallococcus praedator]